MFPSAIGVVPVAEGTTEKEEHMTGHLSQSQTTEDAYRRGYEQALKDINKPMSVVVKNWSPSRCPRCKRSFESFELCFDGYYRRAKSMERCPYCGQTLDW